MFNKRFMSCLLSIILIVGIITFNKNIVRAEVDTKAPQITSISIDKKEATGGEIIKITADITDDLSGVANVSIYYTSPNHIGFKYADLQLNSQGKYEGTIDIGNYDVEGEWTVDFISLGDNAGNYKEVYSYNSGYEFLATANYIVKDTILDSTVPEITSISIDKKEATGGETIKITADINDDLSGVLYVGISYSSPNQIENKYANLQLNSQGKYEGTIDIGNYDAEGEWTVDFISLGDNAGNYKDVYSYDSGYEFLANANYIVKDTILDSTAPEITSISIDKKEATVGETIKITADITDDLSGVSYVYILYRTPNEFRYNDTRLWLNSEGKYEGTINIDTYDEEGEWTVDSIYLCDNIGNEKNVSSSNSGYEFLSNANYIVKGTISDSTPPEITSISIDKKEATAGEIIKITADITDDLSGVSYVDISYWSPNEFGYNYTSLWLNSEGKYEGVIYIDTYDEEGEWTVDSIYLSDNSGNERNVSPSNSGYEFLTNANYVVVGTVDNPRIKVTFNSNGGSLVDSQLLEYDFKVIKPADPTKTGYTFAGWYKESGCLNTWNFITDKVTTDTTLYAKWTINNYVVSFNSQGGSAISNKSADYNNEITEPTSPTKTGYSFGGWYKEAGCLNVWDFTTAKVTTDTTLYAKWTEMGDSKAIGDFVTRLYQQCLNREPDSTGLNYWKNQLMSKESTGADLSYSFTFGTEFVARNVSDDVFINIMYKTFFDRVSDSSGKEYWIGKLNSGISRLYVFSCFVNSAEFSNICASYGIEKGTIKLTKTTDLHPDITAFVYRFYDRCLERKADEVGLTYWVNELVNDKSSGSGLANSFVFSPEFKGRNLSNNDFTRIMYSVFFNRDSDIGGMTYWVNNLNAGMSRLEMFNGFVNSKEFAAICSNYGIKVK